jgi:hypothetical protein
MQAELNDLKWKPSCFTNDHITSSFRHQTYVLPCQTVPVSCPISLLISLSTARSRRSHSASSGRASHHTTPKTTPVMILGWANTQWTIFSHVIPDIIIRPNSYVRTDLQRSYTTLVVPIQKLMAAVFDWQTSQYSYLHDKT